MAEEMMAMVTRLLESSSAVQFLVCLLLLLRYFAYFTSPYEFYNVW